MSSRNLVRSAHLAAGILAFATIAVFWTATVVTEIAGDAATIAVVKQAILWGMLVLVPAMAAVGGSGFRLGGSSRAPIVAVKRLRMMAIAANGLLVLVPSAVFLAGCAAAGDFGAAFVAVQAIELVAGAVNIALMALNMRDGFRLTRKQRSRPLRPEGGGKQANGGRVEAATAVARR
jgi:hypothetical protein